MTHEGDIPITIKCTVVFTCDTLAKDEDKRISVCVFM
jgi:hypothetical protein